MPRLPSHPKAALDAIDRFVEAAFRKPDSLFTPGKPIWSRQNRDALYARLSRSPCAGRAEGSVKVDSPPTCRADC